MKQAKAERKQKMNDFITRQIRTYVPMAVGALVAWVATLGLNLDAETQTGLVVALTGFIQALYYLVVTSLAKKFPKIEILLGSSKTPEYNK